MDATGTTIYDPGHYASSSQPPVMAGWDQIVGFATEYICRQYLRRQAGQRSAPSRRPKDLLFETTRMDYNTEPSTTCQREPDDTRGSRLCQPRFKPPAPAT